MRVLVIDPVGTYSPAQYTHGLCSGLSKLDGYQVTLFTNYYYPFSNRAIYTVGNFFIEGLRIEKGAWAEIL